MKELVASILLFSFSAHLISQTTVLDSSFAEDEFFAWGTDGGHDLVRAMALQTDRL